MATNDLRVSWKEKEVEGEQFGVKRKVQGESQEAAGIAFAAQESNARRSHWRETQFETQKLQTYKAESSVVFFKASE